MNTPNILTRWLTSPKRTPLKLEDIEAILDLLPQATLLVEWPDFKISMANARATEITAYMRSELVGQDLGLILYSQDPDVSVREALQNSSVYTSQADYYILTRSGSRVKTNVSALLDNQARWMLVSLETEKQRERKHVEEQRAHRLWQNLSQLSQALQYPDLQKGLRYILQTACQITGADFAAIYQANSDDLMLTRIAAWGENNFLPEKAHPQDLMNTQEMYIWLRRMHPLSNLQSQARQKGLAYLACARLGEAYARVGIIVMAGKNPPPVILQDALPVVASFATTTIENTTRNEQLQNQLVQKEFEWRAANQLKDEIEDNLILLKPDLTILDFNRAAERSLGYTAKEAINQPYERILICSERLEPQLTRVLEGEPLSELGNVRLFRRDGEGFAARLRILPCQVLTQGLGIAVLFKDLSEEEKILRHNEILEQKAVLGEVTASFAHEVKNPINNISTGLQLLEMDLPADDPNQENIKRLQHDCNRLTALIKSGLSFVRPLEYKVEPIQVEELIENLLMTWRYRLERAKVQTQFQFETGLPKVEGDPRAMEQIFTNLINNAVDAMSGNEPTRAKLLGVKVCLFNPTPDQSQVQVSISDTGVGIPDEIRERIFEPFFTTKPGGTGIGLAIVKRMVTVHRGSVSVDSMPGGTVFQVKFPIPREKNLLT